MHLTVEKPIFYVLNLTRIEFDARIRDFTFIKGTQETNIEDRRPLAIQSEKE